jgi:hypothetical protein
MPSQDYIKGKADIFSFVLEILSGVRVPLTCGEIVDRVERYVNTPIRNPASVTADYHGGNDALSWVFCATGEYH